MQGQGQQIQTLVNDLATKLADGPDSVSLTEYLVLASRALANRKTRLLAAGSDAQAAHAPSPETGLSPLETLQAAQYALAQAFAHVFHAELELASSRGQGDLARAA